MTGYSLKASLEHCKKIRNVNQSSSSSSEGGTRVGCVGAMRCLRGDLVEEIAHHDGLAQKKISLLRACAACLPVPVAPGFGPCSRHRPDHATPARTCAQPYAGLLGQPPEALPECNRDAASQSLCHSSRWSRTLLVFHHHHGADFEPGSLFPHLPVTRAATEL